jgi:regulator of protease activity HflC (stomatin/prohibitin superfamily)
MDSSTPFSNLAIGVVVGLILPFVLAGLFYGLGVMFGLWRILDERKVIVYTLFGKVIGKVEEPGLFFPVAQFGAGALLLPLFGKTYTVSTAMRQAYLRDQLVNSEEGAPMGVGVWYEMLVHDPVAFLFQNADPFGSLQANVATAVSKQLSNLKLQVLLEDRDTLSHRVREEVSPISNRWGYQLGSTYIRKVAFRDEGMITQIEAKVVNRLKQVTAGMKQDGANKVALIQSAADKKASQRLGEAQAVRPAVVGAALAGVQSNPDVANTLFRLLDIQATLKSEGKVTIAPSGAVSLLLSS